MTYRDRQIVKVPLGRYATLSVHTSNLEGMDTKAPCPDGCDEEGKCDRACKRCAGYGYVHKDGDRIVSVVAAEGRAGDWAAYGETKESRDAYLVSLTGPTPLTVAKAIHYHGVKLVQAEAESIFPRWAERLEWRD